MLEFCLLTLASLVLICGALVEQIEEEHREEFSVFLARVSPINEAV